jgi:hypothetical protein
MLALISPEDSRRRNDLTVDPAFNDCACGAARAGASLAANAPVVVVTRGRLRIAPAALTDSDADNDDGVKQQLRSSAQDDSRISEHRGRVAAREKTSR